MRAVLPRTSCSIGPRNSAPRTIVLSTNATVSQAAPPCAYSVCDTPAGGRAPPRYNASSALYPGDRPFSAIIERDHRAAREREARRGGRGAGRPRDMRDAEVRIERRNRADRRAQQARGADQGGTPECEVQWRWQPAEA